MRGEKEGNCLEIICNSIFKPNPYNKKLLYEVSEEEFLDERIFYQQFDAGEHFFGFSEDDTIRFERLLRSVIPNPNISEFPDFVSELGFIEHFQVTSSKTNRKGSVHKKEESLFFEKVEEEEKQFKNEMDITPSFGEVKPIRHTFSFPKHSYEFFVESFTNTWNHHIKSYEKYQGVKDIGAFMIEYQDMALKMWEDFGDIKCEVRYGDLLNSQKRYNYYRISRDKELLNFVYEFKNLIKFVIMVCGNNVEVINIENIPELLKLLPYKFEIHAPTFMGREVSLYGISVPNAVVGKEER